LHRKGFLRVWGLTSNGLLTLWAQETLFISGCNPSLTAGLRVIAPNLRAGLSSRDPRKPHREATTSKCCCPSTSATGGPSEEAGPPTTQWCPTANSRARQG